MCDGPPEEPIEPPVQTETFTRADVSGEHDLMVTMEATARVSQSMLDHLRRTLIVRRVEASELQLPELVFWRDRAMVVDHDFAEITIDLQPIESELESRQFIWMWPDGFEAVRPGVIRVSPSYQYAKGDGLPVDEFEVITRALTDPAYSRVRGRLVCQSGGASNSLAHLKLEIGDHEGLTNTNGEFSIAGSFTETIPKLVLRYDSEVTSHSVTTHLLVMNDRHASHSDTLRSLTGTGSGDTLDLGLLTVSFKDCELWRLGVQVIDHYHREISDSPPAGEFRIKRWGGVYVGDPHAFYDYAVLPANFVSKYDVNERQGVVSHEFGHSIRHVADGDIWHWHWDNFRWAYARNHDGTEIANQQYAFNEGWANYWEALMNGAPNVTGLPGPDFLDWNELLVSERLLDLSAATSPAFMVRVLTDNPGDIHKLYEFEEKYCAVVRLPNSFCLKTRRPLRASPASCPPGFVDDGATCRLNNIKAKPSYGRGGGVPPTVCRSGQDYDAGLCYPECRAGFSGVGPVCWERCPAGYHDDGVTCRRNAHIYGASTSSCPWYDKCGLTFARGCSRCRSGYHNDGCTCRRDAHIFGKESYGRGVGTVPNGCRSNMEYDTGLCYQPCRTGYKGVGPVCWGSCPSGFDDHGATCYRAPKIIVKY
jgi:hypothetical protein